MTLGSAKSIVNRTRPLVSRDEPGEINLAQGLRYHTTSCVGRALSALPPFGARRAAGIEAPSLRPVMRAVHSPSLTPTVFWSRLEELCRWAYFAPEFPVGHFIGKPWGDTWKANKSLSESILVRN